jgi:D-xylose 1-dehydrogenase (NADP+, D-xylono-1,5-lactone-forming)
MLQSQSVELVGVASRSMEKAEEFRAQFSLPRAYGSYEQMLEDPGIQAIYIPLPNGLHGKWTMKAADHRKHVLCEKPFASSAAEARQVAEFAMRRNVTVMEAFMWPFHSQHERAKAAIRDGAIGVVRCIRASFSFPIPRKPNVRLQPDLAGGSVMDIGCYPVSAARYYFEDEPAVVYACGEIDAEYRVDMRMSGVLEFAKGSALVDCAFNLPFRTSLEIVGESGTIVMPKPWQPDPEATVILNGEALKLPEENQYIKEFEHFSRCLIDGTPPRFGAEDAVRQMSVLDSVLRSIRSGQAEPVVC